ncbi:MAG TPA: hypothetical protein PKD54_06955 [Pirellulaceae bacterium]|nr:hypothetical protein [Pirellulaceae bacterium]
MNLDTSIRLAGEPKQTLESANTLSLSPPATRAFPKTPPTTIAILPLPPPPPLVGPAPAATNRSRIAHQPFVQPLDDEPATLAQRARSSLPSCLSSFLFHVILIVALALLYLSPPPDRVLVVSSFEDMLQPNFGEVVDLSVTFETKTLNQEMSQVELPPTEMLPLDVPPQVTETMVESFAGSRYADAFSLSLTGISGSGIDHRATPGDQTEATDQGATNFFGVGSEGKRFVFVIDRSGSMLGMRWELCKQELLRCVERMSEEQEFFVLLYSSDTTAMWNLPIKNIQLVPATPDNFQKLYQWISQVYPSGMTRPREAMRIALDLKPDAIFLLSDGEIQDDTYEFLLANNHPRAREGGSAKTPVHTIALDYTLGALYLQNIAKTNNGKFSQKFSQ